MDFKIARRNMVRKQLGGRGIRDERVISAMLEVPRHLFVDEGLKANAYSDDALPICHGQTISQPYMVALMTEALRLTPTDKVLEIGTGSGYQAAVLARLAGAVYSIERIQVLSDQAVENFRRAGIPNVRVRCGDGTLGWPEEAPFDRVIITAGAPGIPEALFDQLGEGGILVAPVGNRAVQQLRIIEKRGGQRFETLSKECVFVPLIGAQGWKE